MTKTLLLVLFGFNCTLGWAKQTPFEILFYSKTKKVDLDRDGAPDVTRSFNGKGKLKSLIYHPSRNPSFNHTINYTHSGYKASITIRGKKIEDRKLIESGPTKTLTKIIYHPRKTRVIKVLTGDQMNSKLYAWLNSDWVLVYSKKETVPTVAVRDVAKPNDPANYETPPWVANNEVTKKPSPFSVDSTCKTAYDRHIISQASDMLVTDQMSCLYQHNPNLAVNLYAQLSQKKTIIKCYQSTDLEPDIDPKTNTPILPAAVTTLSPHKDIDLISYTPSLAADDFKTPNLQAEELASVLLHELLHQITGEPHSEDEGITGKPYTDGVYGCQVLCSDPKSRPYVAIDIACHKCGELSSTVGDKMARRDPIVNSCEGVKPVPDTPNKDYLDAKTKNTAEPKPPMPSPNKRVQTRGSPKKSFFERFFEGISNFFSSLFSAFS